MKRDNSLLLLFTRAMHAPIPGWTCRYLDMEQLGSSM
jgi:hypothetical protein